jgi:hypothetical protein
LLTSRIAVEGLLANPPVNEPANSSQNMARPAPLGPAKGKMGPGGSA